jgi:hypothetical protein
MQRTHQLFFAINVQLRTCRQKRFALTAALCFTVIQRAEQLAVATFANHAGAVNIKDTDGE